MSNISAKTVMELRAQMGVSLMACKKALLEAGGDMEKAIDILRKSGVAKAGKKSDRKTGEGAIAIVERGIASLRCETDFVARNEDFLSAVNAVATATNDGNEADGEAFFEEKKAELITQLGENITFGEAKRLPEGDVIGGYLHSNSKIASLVSLTGGTEELAKDIAMHVVANSPHVLSPDDISDELVAKEKEIWEEQLKNQKKPENIIAGILKGKEKKFREEGALLNQKFVKNPEITISQLLQDAGAEVEVESFVRIEV